MSHNIRSGQKTFRPERQNTIIFVPGHNIRSGPRNIYLFWAHIHLLKLNLNKQSAFHMVLYVYMYDTYTHVHVGKQAGFLHYILFCKCVI